MDQGTLLAVRALADRTAGTGNDPEITLARKLKERCSKHVTECRSGLLGLLTELGVECVDLGDGRYLRVDNRKSYASVTEGAIESVVDAAIAMTAAGGDYAGARADDLAGVQDLLSEACDVALRRESIGLSTSKSRKRGVEVCVVGGTVADSLRDWRVGQQLYEDARQNLLERETTRSDATGHEALVTSAIGDWGDGEALHLDDGLGTVYQAKVSRSVRMCTVSRARYAEAVLPRAVDACLRDVVPAATQDMGAYLVANRAHIIESLKGTLHAYRTEHGEACERLRVTAQAYGAPEQ